MRRKFAVKHTELSCRVLSVNIIHLKHLTVVLTVLRQQIFAKPKKKV